MKIKSEKIIYPVQRSFKILKYTVPHFEMPFHYHPDYELVYITQGSGRRYIGNSIHNFSRGDMVFLGPDLAHIWVNNKNDDQADTPIESEAIVLQFSRGLFLSLIETPEFSKIRDLFTRSQAGLNVKGVARDQIAEILDELLECEGVNRLVYLIRILDILARDKQQVPLHTGDIQRGLYHQDQRMNAVYHYVMSHYQQKLFIQDAARLAHMEKSAFCRFFKGKTQKTFTRFVNETRIDHACRLLQENKQSVSQIAFEVGFSNLSNFYRQFKKVTQMTPHEYTQRSA